MICGRFKAINERAALDEARVGSRGDRTSRIWYKFPFTFFFGRRKHHGQIRTIHLEKDGIFRSHWVLQFFGILQLVILMVGEMFLHLGEFYWRRYHETFSWLPSFKVSNDQPLSTPSSYHNIEHGTRVWDFAFGFFGIGRFHNDVLRERRWQNAPNSVRVEFQRTADLLDQLAGTHDDIGARETHDPRHLHRVPSDLLLSSGKGMMMIWLRHTSFKMIPWKFV